MQPRVVVVGSFVQDLAFACDAFPLPGETTLGRFIMGPGGKGSNQAVAAARAGAPTRFIGAVGDDPFGRAARAFHRAEGIDSRLVVKPRHATAAAGILVDRTGQNEIVVALGASARLRPRDVPESWIRGARVVVAQHEATLAINAHAFRLARRLGATTVLNPAPMRDDFDPRLLRSVDVLIPNEHEFAALLRRRGTAADDRMIKSLDDTALHALCRSLDVPAVIVTLGDRGCFISQAQRFERLPAHHMKAIDTTGAGDAFVGAFAAGWIEFDGDVSAAARFANAAAALSVTKPGTSHSMPTRRAITRLLRKVK